MIATGPVIDCSWASGPNPGKGRRPHGVALAGMDRPSGAGMGFPGENAARDFADRRSSWRPRTWAPGVGLRRWRRLQARSGLPQRRRVAFSYFPGRTPADRRFIADLADLVPRLDNIEGMTFGPPLASGEQTLIFVSDNNFATQRTITQILAFSVAADAIRGCAPR